MQLRRCMVEKTCSFYIYINACLNGIDHIIKKHSFHFTNPFIVMWHVAIVILPLFPFWFKMSSVVCSTKRMKWSLLVHIFIFEERRTVALGAKDNFRRNFCTCYRTGEDCCKMFMTKPYIYYYGDIHVHSDQMFTVGNITEDYGRTWWTNGHW